MRLWTALLGLLTALMMAVPGAQAQPAPTPTATATPAPSAASGRGDCGNPNRAMLTFLKYQNPPTVNMDRASKCLDDSAGTGRERHQVARRLKFVLDNRGLYVYVDPKDKDNPDYVPPEANYTDPDTGEAKYTPFPDEAARINLVKQDGRWVFSEETVQATDDLFRGTPGWWGFQLQNAVPPGLKKGPFGIAWWQLIGLLLLVGLGMVVRRLVSFIAHRILTPVFERVFAGWGAKLARCLDRPLGTLGLVGAWLLVLPALQFYVRINIIAHLALTVLAILSGFWGIYRMADVLCDVWASRAADTDTKLDDQLVPLARKTAKVFIVIVGGLFILQNMDVDVMSLVAGLGIGGLAFALAAKDTVANLFGSVTIFADHPFQIGDWIVADGTEGIVEEVGFRSTRLRTFYNSLITMPNNKIANAVIDNYGQRKYRRATATLGLTYDTPPDKIQAFCDGARAILQANESVRKDFYLVHFTAFSAASLDIMVYFFLDVPTWNEELAEKQRIYLELLRLAQELGVEFAFPTQTLHIETVREAQPIEVKSEMERKRLREIVEGFGPGGELGRPHGPSVSDGFYCDSPVKRAATVYEAPPEEGNGAAKDGAGSNDG